MDRNRLKPVGKKGYTYVYYSFMCIVTPKNHRNCI